MNWVLRSNIQIHSCIYDELKNMLIWNGKFEFVSNVKISFFFRGKHSAKVAEKSIEPKIILFKMLTFWLPLLGSAFFPRDKIQTNIFFAQEHLLRIYVKGSNVCTMIARFLVGEFLIKMRTFFPRFWSIHCSLFYWKCIVKRYTYCGEETQSSSTTNKVKISNFQVRPNFVFFFVRILHWKFSRFQTIIIEVVCHVSMTELIEWSWVKVKPTRENMTLSCIFSSIGVPTWELSSILRF